MPTKILIDTDPGQDIDDLLAIWFALLRPELDVRAITTVTWPSDKRARLVNRLLRFLGRSDIAVAAGMQYPLRPMGAHESAVKQDLGTLVNHYSFAMPEDPQDDPSGGGDAVDLIIRTVEANAGDITLCCIAPLTNIATAICREPGIAKKIRQILLMGGETALNRREHNIGYDYNASNIVMTSGVPIVMGTWDVTRRFVLSKDDCDAIGKHGELGAAMGRAIADWHPVQNWKPGPVMYDIFPIIHAYDQSYYTIDLKPVQVETNAGPTRGMTVVSGDGPKIGVTTDIRADAVRDMYLKTILG